MLLVAANASETQNSNGNSLGKREKQMPSRSKALPDKHQEGKRKLERVEGRNHEQKGNSTKEAHLKEKELYLKSKGPGLTASGPNRANEEHLKKKPDEIKEKQGNNLKGRSFFSFPRKPLQIFEKEEGNSEFFEEKPSKTIDGNSSMRSFLGRNSNQVQKEETQREAGNKMGKSQVIEEDWVIKKVEKTEDGKIRFSSSDHSIGIPFVLFQINRCFFKV